MEKLLNLSIESAIKAGFAINEIYNNPDSDFQVEIKADNSPLTIADRRSNDVISSYLKNTPYHILSEEGKKIDFETRKEWHTLWIVDPLDGTKEFIKRNGEFTVNIALVEDGTPIMGVIYIPVKKVLYFGAKGVGSYKVEEIEEDNILTLKEYILKGRKLPIKRDDNGVYKIVASRSHCSDETLKFIEEIKLTHPNIEMTSSGSSIKICLVAEGAADIYPRFAPTMEWDTAAGHAIVLYSGKQIYKKDNVEHLTYNKEDLLNPWFIVR
ncbi:MAG: 3'(2'),5'-bisphosphate nucleotidase CysQ [Bacteroidales bacterium]|nr:3'(2'),5'-bisphosphate nucleotidase CysQ [Bacteroidales bacterium]